MRMICPACGGHLADSIKADVIVRLCDHGCGGMWFAQGELEKVDEAHESAGQALLDASRHRRVAADPSKKRHCPECEGIVMQRHFFSVRQDLEIDECGGCGGIWLDAGELATIRIQVRSAKGRKEAAERYFSVQFNEELARQAAQGQAHLARIRKLTRALRFLCPTYWIPGKQSWGAY